MVELAGIILIKVLEERLKHLLREEQAHHLAAGQTPFRDEAIVMASHEFKSSETLEAFCESMSHACCSASLKSPSRTMPPGVRSRRTEERRGRRLGEQAQGERPQGASGRRPGPFYIY